MFDPTVAPAIIHRKVGETSMPRDPSETVQLKLRFPERLRNRIEAAAEKNQRSMNAEIVARLEQSFARDDRSALVENTASTTARNVIAELLAAPPQPVPPGGILEALMGLKKPPSKKDKP